MGMVLNYYKLLGINETASASEIRRQYRVLSKKHHPDVGGSQQMMESINEAYRTLTNPTLREIYDDKLRQFRQQSSTTSFASTLRTTTPKPPTEYTSVRHVPVQKSVSFWPRFAALVGVGAVLIFFALIHPNVVPAAADSDTANAGISRKAKESSVALDQNAVPSGAAQSSPQQSQPQADPAKNVASSNSSPTAPAVTYVPVNCSELQNQQRPECAGQTENGVNCTNNTQGAITYTKCQTPNGKTYCIAKGSYTFKYYRCED